MLQSIATLVSLVIAASMLALIVAMLSDDWRLVVRALRLRQPFQIAPLPARARSSAGDRRAQVVRVSSQSAPRHAAA